MKSIITKWYKSLEFPKHLDDEFFLSLDKVSDETLSDFLENAYRDENEHILNLFRCLYRCEDAYKMYQEKGIGDDIFFASMKEIVTETVQCKEDYGVLGVWDTYWMNLFLECKKIFRIGRLNFDMEIAGDHECEGDGINKADKVILVHIPADKKLDIKECEESFIKAEEFFNKYFPDFDYKCFLCGSWLLWDGLGEFLSPDSNITRFRLMFKPYKKIKSDSSLRFAFGRTVTRDNIKDFLPKNSLQRGLKEYILNGGDLYEGFGTIDRINN